MKILVSSLMLALALGPAFADGLPKADNYAGAAVADRQQIIDVIGSVGFYADQRRWDLVEAAFAERAVIDYRSQETAAAGQSEPQALTPREIVTAWQTQLPGYLHTQHLITNPIVRVEGDRATATSQVYATHFLPNDQGEDFWTFIGFYEHELERRPEGWRITLMRANKQFELGNPDLPKLAAARVAAGDGRTQP